MNKITLIEVKQALKDYKFRDKIPQEFREDVAKYLQNPSCPCNLPLYRKIFDHCKTQLEEYFPGREIGQEEVAEPLPENNFSVINCHINELELKLKMLLPGPKQIAVCRYEDQVTAIVNELERL